MQETNLILHADKLLPSNTMIFHIVYLWLRDYWNCILLDYMLLWKEKVFFKQVISWLKGKFNTILFIHSEIE